jgi:hydrogenase-4 component E
VIGVALSMLLIGLFLMVTRKKAITQILALLTVENAVFLVAVGVTSGMPFIVEFGISFDVILAVLVLGILVQRIVGRFESMDVSRLSKLKG